MRRMKSIALLIVVSGVISVGGINAGAYMARQFWPHETVHPRAEAISAEEMYQRMVGNHAFQPQRRTEIIACLEGAITGSNGAAPCFTPDEIERIHASHGVYGERSIGI